MTTWLNLQGFRVSEAHQTVKDKYHVISHVESKEAEPVERESFGGCWGWGLGAEGIGKMLVKWNQFPIIRWVSVGDTIYGMATPGNKFVHLQVARRVDLKYSFHHHHHKHGGHAGRHN